MTAKSNDTLENQKFDLGTARGVVENRLFILMSLKRHRYPKFLQWRDEYKMGISTRASDSDDVNYYMNTWFAIVNSKAAELMTNMPKYDFLAEDEEARTMKKVREILWNHVWLTSRTDEIVLKIVLDALKYWVWFGMEYIRTEQRKIKKPKEVKFIEDWIEKTKIEWREEYITDYDDVFLEHVNWENAYLDSTDIETATECIVVKHWKRDEFISKYANNPIYSNVSEDSIPKWKRYYYINQTSVVDERNLTIQFNPTSETKEYQDVVSELRYFNKARDAWIVLANWQWINPIDWDAENYSESNTMGIPFSHKELPLLTFIDHYIEDDIYHRWEFDISEGSRNVKNSIRSLQLEATKAQFWFTIIHPDADFEEGVVTMGLRDFARLDPKDVSHYSPNINTNNLVQMEAKLDEDIIIETWVDFKSQLLWPWETATKTDSRVQSARKRINLNLKINAYKFFERLARLRMSNMETHYEGKSFTVSVKGWSIDDKWKYTPINWGYGTFTMKPEYMKGKFRLIPIADSMINDSSSQQKERFMQFVNLTAQMVDPDTWKPLFNPRNIVEASRWLFDDPIDIDKLLQKTPDKKSPEQIMKEAWMDVSPLEWNTPPLTKSPFQQSKPLGMPSLAATDNQ